MEASSHPDYAKHYEDWKRTLPGASHEVIHEKVTKHLEFKEQARPAVLETGQQEAVCRFEPMAARTPWELRAIAFILAIILLVLLVAVITKAEPEPLPIPYTRVMMLPQAGNVPIPLPVQGSGSSTPVYVICSSGCSAGGSFADNSAFTVGTTPGSILFGYYTTGAAPTITSGSAARARIDASSYLYVDCATGCSGSSFQDNSSFTAGTTSIGITGGWYAASPTACTTGNACAPSMTIDRKMFVQDFQGTSPWVVSNGGTFATQSAQSGTWNITNVSGTVSLPTGAATAAKQPALGTAGTASTDVISVQGIASMTPLAVTLASAPTTAVTIADGADVTQGAKADAKSTATDTTAVTLMQVLKEISFMEQTPASRAVTNAGTFAVQAVQSGNWTSRTVGNGGATLDFAQGGATAPTNALAIGGVYNTSFPTLTNGQAGAAQLDSSSRILVNCASGCSGGSGGTSATDEATFTQGSSSFTPVGCFYAASITSLTTAQGGAFQCTADRNLFINLNKIGGTAYALGSTTSSASAPVVIASDQAAVSVKQSTAANLNATVVGTGTFAVQDATVEGAISSSVMQSNTKQVNGVTTSTGAGAVGTGSQRVSVGQDTTTIAGSAPGTAGSASANVVTVQGVASMTKLLVTPDSVALPANQSVNVAQLAGTTTDTNSGNKSAGTLRVVIATDQPQLTNKLLVTPDANSAVNLGQVAGNTTSTGNGTSGTGVQRVAVASDNTAFETIPVTTATTTDTASRCTLISAASTNSTSCKGSAGNVYGYRFVNTTATLYYLRMYNSSSAPTCSSATGFIETIPIPASATGAGIVSMEPFGEGYSTGIGFCFTGGSSSTDNTNAATGVFGTILYK
jgi:hypothetical protein